MSQPRNGSRRRPSKSAARHLCRQIGALHTLVVHTAIAARITSQGSVINKLGRSAIREQQISPDLLKWTLASHSGSFRSIHWLSHVARRQSCSSWGLATNCHCALPPCPPPTLSCSWSPQWQEPGNAPSQFWHNGLFWFGGFQKLFTFCTAKQNPQAAQLQTCNTQAGKGMWVP